MAAVPAKAQKRAAKAPKAQSPGVGSTPATKRGRGAPKGSNSKRTPALLDEIVERVSNGETLRAVCRDIDLSWRSAYDWVNDDPIFASRLARARDLGYDCIAEQALLIADTPVDGRKVVETDDGKMVYTREDMLGHRKLQIETRLKLLAVWNPSKYGLKTVISGDKDGAAIKTEDVGSSRLFEMIRNLELTKRVG